MISKLISESFAETGQEGWASCKASPRQLQHWGMVTHITIHCASGCASGAEPLEGCSVQKEELFLCKQWFLSVGGGKKKKKSCGRELVSVLFSASFSPRWLLVRRMQWEQPASPTAHHLAVLQPHYCKLAGRRKGMKCFPKNPKCFKRGGGGG